MSANRATNEVTQSTVRFHGGPLDGRQHPLPVDESGHIVTHTFLHGGPKIETRYRLERDETGLWSYRLLDTD
jgi:hypothetical protein